MAVEGCDPSNWTDEEPFDWQAEMEGYHAPGPDENE